MTEKRFLEALNGLDDGLLAEAVPEYTGTPSAKVSHGLAAAICAAAAAAIAVGIAVFFRSASVRTGTDSVSEAAVSEAGTAASDVSRREYKSIKNDGSGPEIVCAEFDREYIGFDQLIEEADIIMIGEYLDDGEPTVLYGDPQNKAFPYDGYTYNTLAAITVYKGADKIGPNGTVRISEGYALTVTAEGKEQILVGTELTPKGKGDRMIFILKYGETQKAYVPYYGSEGRFPLPGDLDKRDKYGFKNGIADEYLFQSGIYYSLLEKYGITDADNHDNGVYLYYSPGKSIEVISAEIDFGYHTYEELIETSDIIMIGEYLDDGEVKMDYGDPVNKKFIRNERTYNTVKALKVFKGEDKIGADGTVRIVAGYALTTDNSEDGHLQLLLCSELVPMYKGDKAIFILKAAKSGAYSPRQSQGRFPLPEDLGKTDKYGFKNGLAPGVSFQSGIYSRLCSDYGIK